MNFIKLIGVGGFGRVYLTEIDSKKYAVKVYKKSYILKNNVEDLVNQEAFILKTLSKYPQFPHFYYSA